MNYGKSIIALWVLLGIAPLFAQKADFFLNEVALVKGQAYIQSPVDLKARVSLYSFEEYLSLVVEVEDDYQDINPGEYLTDHVELFLALPLSAFPPGFEQVVHPYYLHAASTESRGGKESPSSRFFSSQKSSMKEMEVSAFLQENAYPEGRTIRKDSLEVPFPSQILRKRIDYGIVHFGLFLDGRSPLLYNKKYHQILEKDLNFNMGPVESGITYVVDRTEKGYTLTAQIEPKALGFIQLPEMNTIRFSLDVVDTDGVDQEGISVLSVTNGGSHSMKERTFLEVDFARPLKTNFSDTPDRVYNEAAYFPTFAYADTGWIPLSLDIDALYFRKDMNSDQLSEVRFLHRPQTYEQETFPQHYLSVEKLSIDYQYVNLLGRRVNYTLLNGQVFKSQNMDASAEKGAELPDMQVFFFPDNTPGLIMAENATLSPYGWGDTGHYLDERIRILRINRTNYDELLRIEQGEGAPGYCHIGKGSYPDFFVEKINWAHEGQVMVLLLQHRQDQSRKRLRVSWQENGSEIEIQELP